MKAVLLFGAGLVVVASLVAGAARAADDEAVKLTAARVAEREALATWEWRTREDLSVGGKLVLRQFRAFGPAPTGELRSKVLMTRPIDPSKPLGRPDALPAELQAKRWSDECDATLRQYLAAPADVLLEFFARAAQAPGPRSLPGTLQVQGHGMLRSGDQVTWWLDQTTGRAVRLEILAPLKEDELKLVVDFGTAQGVPAHPSGLIGEIATRNFRMVANAFELHQK